MEGNREARRGRGEGEGRRGVDEVVGDKREEEQGERDGWFIENVEAQKGDGVVDL